MSTHCTTCMSPRRCKFERRLYQHQATAIKHCWPSLVCVWRSLWKYRLADIALAQCRISGLASQYVAAHSHLFSFHVNNGLDCKMSTTSSTHSSGCCLLGTLTCNHYIIQPYFSGLCDNNNIHVNSRNCPTISVRAHSPASLTCFINNANWHLHRIRVESSVLCWLWVHWT